MASLVQLPKHSHFVGQLSIICDVFIDLYSCKSGIVGILLARNAAGELADVDLSEASASYHVAQLVFTAEDA